MPDLSIPGSTLHALGAAMGVSAFNVANANTPGFTVSRASQPAAMDGDKIRQNNECQVAGLRIPTIQGESSTDLPREFATHIAVQSAHSATAATIRAMDELTGSLLNVKV